MDKGQNPYSLLFYYSGYSGAPECSPTGITSLPSHLSMASSHQQMWPPVTRQLPHHLKGGDLHWTKWCSPFPMGQTCQKPSCDAADEKNTPRESRETGGEEPGFVNIHGAKTSPSARTSHSQKYYMEEKLICFLYATVKYIGISA